MRRWAFPPLACLCWTISRMVFTDSCLAESMKEQVLTTRISASSAWLVSSPPARWSRPIMTSESTRFLGQPRETKPILGRAGAAVAGVESSRMTGEVTEFYFSNLPGKLSDWLARDVVDAEDCHLFGADREDDSVREVEKMAELFGEMLVFRD